MLKIIHAYPSLDPLKDPDVKVWARYQDGKNSERAIITTRGPISPNICSLFQSSYLFGYGPLKFNLIPPCADSFKVQDTLDSTYIVTVWHLWCTGCIHKWWVGYPRHNHKSLLIQGASCQCQCHCSLLLPSSDLWPHTWCCCQKGSIWHQWYTPNDAQRWFHSPIMRFTAWPVSWSKGQKGVKWRKSRDSLQNVPKLPTAISILSLLLDAEQIEF